MKTGKFILTLFLLIQGVGYGQTLRTINLSNEFHTISKKDTTYLIEGQPNWQGFVGKDPYEYTRRLHTALFVFSGTSTSTSIEILRIKIKLSNVTSSKKALVKISNNSNSLGDYKAWYNEIASFSTLATVSSTNELILERSSIPSGILNLFEGISNPEIVMGIMNIDESNASNGINLSPVNISIEYYITYKLVVDIKKTTYNFFTTDINAFKLNSQYFPYTQSSFTRYFKENSPIQIEASNVLIRSASSDTAAFDKITMGSDTTEQLTFSFIKGTATQNLIIHNSPVKNIRPFNDLVNGTVETHIAGSTFNISQNGILTGSDISGQKYIVPIDKTIKIATNVPKGIVSGVLSDHQNWDGAFADFQRFFELETNATTPVVSNIHAKHHPIYSQTMFVAIDGVLQTDMGIQFKDPWKVVNGIRPWNWDSYLRPFTPGTGIDTEYGGLFKGVSYFESNPGFAHYKVKTNDLISSNGLEGYFSNWDGTGSYFYNRTSLETPVRFDAANAVVTANYKGHLRTGVPQNTDSKNQYRLTNMGVYTNNLMVYESMGKCWIASTGDNGANWSQEKQLSTSIGGKNPSLSNTIYYYNKPIAVAAWVDTAGGVYDVHLQSLTNQGGSDYWGWEWTNQPSVRNASNHLSLTQLVGEDARSDARPVVWLSREGDDVILTWAFEGTNSGILTGQLWLDGNGVSLPEIAAGQPYVTGGQMWDMSLVISSSVNDKYPVLISYPAAYSQPARLALYYLGTGYAAGHRIVEYDYLTTTKRVLATAPNDYTYLSLSGASNETSASFALVATAQVNYPTTSYNTNIYTKPTYSGNSLPTVAKVYTNTVSPAIMVQNTASFGSPVYQVHMTNSGTSTRVKADGGSSITTIAPTSAGSWVSAQVPAGIRKAMVVRSTTTPATIQYYSGSGSLTKAGDFSVDVRAYRYYTLKSGVSGGAILDFSGSRVESVDSLETGENLAVIEVREPSVNGVLVRQPDSLAVPLSVDVIRDGASIAAYAAASWKVLGVASFTDLQTGDLLRFRLADPAVSIWGFEVYSVWEEGLQKDSPEENPVTQLDELKEGIRLYPNPFNPVTTFEISLKAPQTVRLAVYNLLGQQVSELVSGELGAGRHSFPFNGSNLSSGTYFYRLETAGEVKTGKLQLLK